MKVGITEVAGRAGVSEATVSRVINRRQGVSRTTREAVEQAMAGLGYERQTQGQLVAPVTRGRSADDGRRSEGAAVLGRATAQHGLTQQRTCG
ncbi:LacI family DNA-binding transcriptional regulator [Streptomyces sp. 900105755]